ncbi:hypothetical protein R11007_01747 [Ralstonia holmesii]|uniref:Uncharacterized protein n=1 Tax=Ralstonia holmesii TaxID=3058602 RepID=A0ABC8QGL0_9RALS|nr:hypothetical protein R11007_01747 [Ralstonia sp. LMG 32967]CAJ0800124.1 hypothetical protein LMG18096_03793 [Ralstonia sp. LMG 32967]CAJ0818817.1 hypothetical protein LMG18093_03818 [Ralstonia sp. LMG 32967]
MGAPRFQQRLYTPPYFPLPPFPYQVRQVLDTIDRLKEQKS